ncbi:MAG: hypothetical protein MRERC_11c044 [Mycoplasmataceae bacterium RC_NB112A]|nr:MAG: hypothetical protein MRERC_11c044 [Mycoplasmataceae bacterium RC_NB112A]
MLVDKFLSFSYLSSSLKAKPTSQPIRGKRKIPTVGTYSQSSLILVFG